MRFLKDAGSILLSAALLALAFPASDLHFLAWIALVPLFVRIRDAGPWRALLLSLSTGYLFYAAHLWWALCLDGMNPFNFNKEQRRLQRVAKFLCLVESVTADDHPGNRFPAIRRYSEHRFFLRIYLSPRAFYDIIAPNPGIDCSCIRRANVEGGRMNQDASIIRTYCRDRQNPGWS